MMARFLLCCLLLCTAGCGCGSKQVSVSPSVDSYPAEASLWQIKIVYWGTERFNGLLGLQQDVDELHAILLDSTGLSVFDGIIDQEGNMEILQALEQIKKHRLPELLGTSLTEIFFLQADRPCPWYCLGCASTEENDHGRIIRKHFGPVTLRTIHLQYEHDAQVLKEVEWSMNFPSVGIYLLRMDNKEN